MDVFKELVLGKPKRKTQQHRYLNRYRGTHRFNDFDKDGVVNGLDCRWRDPTKHENNNNDEPEEFDPRDRKFRRRWEWMPRGKRA